MFTVADALSFKEPDRDFFTWPKERWLSDRIAAFRIAKGEDVPKTRRRPSAFGGTWPESFESWLGKFKRVAAKERAGWRIPADHGAEGNTALGQIVIDLDEGRPPLVLAAKYGPLLERADRLVGLVASDTSNWCPIGLLDKNGELIGVVCPTILDPREP